MQGTAVTGLAMPPEVLGLGVVTGLSYALLAVGLILAFRMSRVINFAHGQVGAFAAVGLGIMVQRWGVEYWLAFPLALAIGGALSAGIELVVVRRLRGVTPLMTLVATLGVAQVLLFLTVALGADLTVGRSFPQPPGLPSFQLGGLRVTEATVALVVLGPAVVVALALLLTRTVLGTALRAGAANPDGARALGLSAPRLAATAWALGGAVAALTAIFVLPAGGVTTTEALGPHLLLRGLAVAVIAGMASLPVALVAGVTLGIVEETVRWNDQGTGTVEVVLFGVILAGLLLRPAARGRLAERDDWTAVLRWPPLPSAARAVPLVRWAGRGLAGVAIMLAAAAPLVLGAADELKLTSVVCYALVGLSVWVVMGLVGQISLGQFALAGIGAMVAVGVGETTGSPATGLLAAPIGAAGVAVAVGVPALRIRGAMLAVSSLALALATEAWLLGQEWALGGGAGAEKLAIGPLSFAQPAEAYLLSLAMLTVALVAVGNLARTGFGRRARAVRDNDGAARAFGVPGTLVQLQAFGLAGALAGLAGALLAQALFQVTPATFAATENIDVVAMTVLGGLAIAAGPVVGALYVVALPAFVSLSGLALAASAAGWLLLLLAAPGGLAAILEPLRRRGIEALMRAAGHPAHGIWEPPDAAPARPGLATLAAGLAGRQTGDGGPERPPALEIDGLVRHYGGVRAVDGVSLTLPAGQLVALVGPNGAGKSTLFDLVTGVVPAQAGRVTLDGRDITHLPTSARATAGLVRSFQDAALFPTLTVREVVALGLERRRPSRLLACLTGIRNGEAERRRRADELVALFGLEPWGDTPVGALSTGTRRVAELACMVALEPAVLLLDEPTGGLAQREAEALAGLLAHVRAATGMTMVVIEHDMPLVLGIADRIVVLAEGRVLADGTPGAVACDAGAAAILGLEAPASEAATTDLAEVPA